MTRCIKILSLCIIFFSCDLSKEENKVENLNNESELLTKLPKVDFLEDFSNQFIEDNDIDQWTKFISFKESIESISNLDPKGITFYLDELEKKIQEFISAGIEWLPINKISLDKEQTQAVLNFLETLEDDDDVQYVYANLEIDSNFLLKAASA